MGGACGEGIRGFVSIVTYAFMLFELGSKNVEIPAIILKAQGLGFGARRCQHLP